MEKKIIVFSLMNLFLGTVIYISSIKKKMENGTHHLKKGMYLEKFESYKTKSK